MARPLVPPEFGGICRVPWFSGCRKLRIVSTGDTNATLVNAGPATLEAVVLFNKNAAVRWMKFYDQAAKPTVGTDTVDWVLALPASETQPIVIPFGVAVPFLTGFAFGITTGDADSDTGALSAGDVQGLLLWSGQS